VILVGIGELFIPHDRIREGFAAFRGLGVEVRTLDWRLPGFPALQEINHLVEESGPDVWQPPAEIVDAVREADILVTEFCPVGRALIDAAPHLAVIGILRAGTENVNVAHATSRGILVYNTPGRNADSVADFTVGLIICECRNIARGHHGLKEGRWIRDYHNQGRIPDLPGRSVGLVGLGEIGAKVAKRLAGFDVRLLGHDPYVRRAPPGVTLVSLEQLAAESDFVSIHARLTPATERLIGRDIIARMKPTAYLVNTARSGLVDEQALYEALRDGRLEGAALDVFDTEPPGADHPLVRLDNVTLTPHMAGGSNDAFFNSPARLAAEMATLWDGVASRFIVNPEVFPRALQRLKS
jgi:D-3-phosphoglycerate dehydrogenase / 2-oxoglutarate reductase